MHNNFNNINALVIDNNSSMRQIMVSMLRVMGMKNVIVANSEKQCLDLIAIEKINLVICGWSLPKLNALSVLEKLRSHDSTISIPFVIVSTIIEQDKIRKAIELGVSEYLVPPFNKKIFEERVKKALKIPIQSTAVNLSRAINSKRFNQKKTVEELNVLIVDDMADNIEIIKELIKDKYKVKAALNANNAMKICLSDSPPDLILLDIMMPEVDGLTLCRQLKENPLTQNIVVIFLTALTETKDVVKGLSLGAVDYITKPIIPEILLARIEVHSKIILNQRIIQGQIDNLVKQSDVFNKYNKSLQSKLSRLLTDSSERLTELSRLVTGKTTQPLMSQLTYDIGMSRTLLEEFNLLTLLQQDTYKLNNHKEKLGLVLRPIIHIFDSVITSRNVEAFAKIDEFTDIYCDTKLLKVAFTCLYNITAHAAPRGSKISVTTESHHSFMLIQLKHIVPLPDETINNVLALANTRYFTQDIGINLAFLAMQTLKGELYFHSSKDYGTSFYFKIPFKSY